VAISVYNPMLAFIYFAILLIAYIWFKLTYKDDKKSVII